jgi:hypothetical protein
MGLKEIKDQARDSMRRSTDPWQRRRAAVLDEMDATRAEVANMGDELFLQKIMYYRDNSCNPEYQHRYPIVRGETSTYDAVLHLIMYPELFRRLPRLIPTHVYHHHFLCDVKEGRKGCDQRCTYDWDREIPF